MKKLYLCAAVVSAAVVFTTSPAMAADNSIKADLGKNSVTLTYTNTAIENTTDASKLMKNFSGMKESDNYATETLTVTSIKTTGSEPIEVLIKLSDNNPGANNDASVLDYYNFKITDASGEIVYDTAEEGKTDSGVTEKYISLGEFNKGFSKDTKTYNVSCKIDKDVKAAVKSADNLVIELATAPIEAPTQAPVVTDAPEENTVTAEVTEEPAPTEEATELGTEAPAETLTPDAPVKSTIKTVGKDIDAGRYIVSGNANIKITDKNGKLKSEEVVTDGTLSKDAKGVKQFIVNLNDGDIITITPLEGQEKAPVSFEKTNTTAAASTDKNKSKTNTAKTAAESKKSNPKTGDTGMAVGMIFGIMAVCGMGYGALEFLKRRSKG